MTRPSLHSRPKNQGLKRRAVPEKVQDQVIDGVCPASGQHSAPPTTRSGFWGGGATVQVANGESIAVA